MAEEAISIDVNDLTLGEIEEIENISGKSIGEAFKGDMSAKLILALAYVSRRRDNPEFTLDDARKLPFSVLNKTEVAATDDPSDEGA